MISHEYTSVCEPRNKILEDDTMSPTSNSRSTEVVFLNTKDISSGPLVYDTILLALSSPRKIATFK
jgi:hypothetical protein